MSARRANPVVGGPRRRWLRACLRPAIAAGALVLLPACGRERAQAFHSVDVTGATFGHGFALTDHSGAPRTLDDYRGKVVVLFFGFTQCPDACPSALSRMVEVRRRLGGEGADLQVLFVTLDPDRDTRELLGHYVPAFDASFVGLMGTPAQIAETAKAYKVFHAKVKGQTASSYTIDHSTFLYVHDRQGRLRLMARESTTVDQLVDDLGRLLKARPA